MKHASLESGIWKSYVNLYGKLKKVTVDDVHVQTVPPDQKLSEASRAIVIIDARDTGAHFVGGKLNWDTGGTWDKGSMESSFGRWQLRPQAEAIVKREKLENLLNEASSTPTQ